MTDLSSIAMTRWGDSGEPIVLVHGGVQGTRRRGADHFPRQERLAARGYQLLVPDRPGHGLSPAPGRPDDAEADGVWVAELLGEGAHLVGHSFGGCVALAAAARRPQAVKTLTLIEPGMQAIAIQKWPVLRFVARLAATQLLPLSDRARIERLTKIMRIPPESGGAPSPEESAAMGKALKTLRPATRRDLERELAVVRQAGIPLLVVTGGWSPGVDVTADEVARLGHGQRITIPSPHHFPQSIADEFNDRLVAFMTSASRLPLKRSAPIAPAAER